MKKCLSLLALLLSLVILAGCAPAQPQTPASQAAAGIRSLLGAKKSLLADESICPAGSSAFDWIAMAFAIAGEKEDYDSYLSALERYVTARYAEYGTLDQRKATEFHRISLTILALGGDPTCFGTDAAGNSVDLIRDGTYAYAGELGAQGLNGLIFGLITLDAGAYAVPADAKFTREMIVDAILEAQEPDGGFGLMPGTSDPDITAMALQALAPYAERAPEAIEAALDYLAGAMSESCTYYTYNTETVETGCQVVIALTALGLDPAAEQAFCRGERNLLTGIEGFRMSDGSFAHRRSDAEGNLVATEQAMLALLSLERLSDGAGLYDFSKWEGPKCTN